MSATDLKDKVVAWVRAHPKASWTILAVFVVASSAFWFGFYAGR